MDGRDGQGRQCRCPCDKYDLRGRKRCRDRKDHRGPPGATFSAGFGDDVAAAAAANNLEDAARPDNDTPDVVYDQAVNKRRAAAFDMLDEKRMEVLTQKAAFLLRNATLHDTQHRYEHVQRMLAEKFGALLMARSDKFRCVGAAWFSNAQAPSPGALANALAGLL